MRSPQDTAILDAPYHGDTSAPRHVKSLGSTTVTFHASVGWTEPEVTEPEVTGSSSEEVDSRLGGKQNRILVSIGRDLSLTPPTT